MTKYDRIKSVLLEEYEEGLLKHAYIFESSDIDVALKFSRELCCKILDTEDLSMVSDYHFIAKGDMNIQTIRNIVRDIRVKPFKEKSLYVFEDTEDFTLPMQNALLKTLEEPPEHAIFIFLSQNALSLLETVRSRCVRYFFDEDITDVYEREDIALITRRLFDILIAKNRVDMIAYMKEMQGYKKDMDDILTCILDNSRNIMIAKESIQLLPDEHKQNKYIHDIINKFTYYQLLTIIDIAEETRRKLNGNCNFTMTIEVMLLNMMEVSC